LARQALVHEHFQECLVTNAFAIRNPARPCEIGLRQTEGDLHAPLLVQRSN